MALRSSAQLGSLLSSLRTGSGSSSFATSTVPKMKPHPPAADHGHDEPSFKLWPIRGEFAPVYVAVGLIALSVSFGVHTAMHQIKWGPSVRLKKSRRETVQEVVEPERVAEEADHFISNSFFRKVAHVQDSDRQQVMSNPISGDVYAWKNRGRVETLKDVGVEPTPKDSAPYNSRHDRASS